MHILCSAVPESICDTIRIYTARTSHRGKVRGVGRAPLWPQATSNPLKKVCYMYGEQKNNSNLHVAMLDI